MPREDWVFLSKLHNTRNDLVYGSSGQPHKALSKLPSDWPTQFMQITEKAEHGSESHLFKSIAFLGCRGYSGGNASIQPAGSNPVLIRKRGRQPPRVPMINLLDPSMEPIDAEQLITRFCPKIRNALEKRRCPLLRSLARKRRIRQLPVFDGAYILWLTGLLSVIVDAARQSDRSILQRPRFYSAGSPPKTVL